MPAAARRAPLSRLLPGAAAVLAAFLLLPAAPALAQSDPALPVVRLFVQTIPDPVPEGVGTDRWQSVASHSIIEGTGSDRSDRTPLRYRVRSSLNTNFRVNVRRLPQGTASGNAPNMGFSSKQADWVNFPVTLTGDNPTGELIDGEYQTGYGIQRTNGNSAATEDGIVVLSIDPNDSVTLGEHSMTTVTILDDDTVMNVTPTQDSLNVITEGGSATFTVTPDPSPSLVARTVRVNLTATGDVRIKGEAFREAVLAVDSTSAFFHVQTLDNNVAGQYGEIRAEVASGGAWKVGTVGVVKVLDNEIAVSISGPETVSEGDQVVFTVSRNSPSLSALPVNVQLPNGSQTTATISANETSVTLPPVDTTDDTTAGGDSTLTASVTAGTGYSIGTPSSATVTVLDDDMTLTLSTSATSPLAEGDTVTFTLTANPAPTSARTVPVDFSTNEQFKLVGSTHSNENRLTVDVPLPANETEVTFSVQIQDDNFDSNRGRLQAQIQSGAWNIGAPSPIRLDIDNNDRPTATLSTTQTQLVEGERISVTVTLAPTPLSRTGVTVAFPNGNKGTFFTYLGGDPCCNNREFQRHRLTQDSYGNDNTPEPDSMAAANVVFSGNHGRGDPSSVSIPLLDDDTVMEISAQTTRVAEGRAGVEFTVTPNPSPSLVERTVGVDLSVTSGDFELVGNARRDVLIGVGTTSATFTVEIAGDDILDTPGELRAQVRDDGVWKVDNETRSASVTIVDSTPGVTISPPAPVSEGATAVFTLNVFPTPLSTISVGVTYPPSNEESLSVNAGESTTTFSVPTSNSAGDSTVTATVLTGTGYVVGTESTADATVLDADAAMSITAGETSIAEGESAVFTVTANPPPPSPRTVSVNVAVTGEFAIEGGVPSHMLELSTATPTAMFMVTIGDDDEGESSGALTATLASGPGYQLGTAASATVTLNSNDGNPDVNASRSVDASDALILYYAYALRGELGNGR